MGPGEQRIEEILLCSPDHRGATGPMLYPLGLDLVYVGDEKITVGAGSFDAHHFQVPTNKELPEEFLEIFIVDENFRDPFKNRPVLKSEVACFLSHKKAWQRSIDLNQPLIVMEDDAIIKSYIWNEELFMSLIKVHDFVYLQRNENEPNKVVSVNKHV